LINLFINNPHEETKKLKFYLNSIIEIPHVLLMEKKLLKLVIWTPNSWL